MLDLVQELLTHSGKCYLSEVTWNDIKVPQTERASGNQKQTSLSDF